MPRPHVTCEHRSIGDIDAPLVAKSVYEYLFSSNDGMIKLDDIPYALDDATQKLRAQGLHPSRWAPFIHLGL